MANPIPVPRIFKVFGSLVLAGGAVLLVALFGQYLNNSPLGESGFEYRIAVLLGVLAFVLVAVFTIMKSWGWVTAMGVALIALVCMGGAILTA